MSQSIVLGAGCFWCTEASFNLITGVIGVLSGYAGGSVPNPSYDAVSSGKTGHAEVNKITFDPEVISLTDVLDIFWAMHDPTTPNRQGSDVGTQYRSIILYNSDEQKEIATASINETQKLWENPIVTQLEPLDAFYPAEEYHQRYFDKHPEAAYCQIVINPKLAKLREKFSARIKA